MTEKISWWGFSTVVGGAVCFLCFWGYTDLRASDTQLRAEFSQALEKYTDRNNSDHKEIATSLHRIEIRLGVEK